METLNTMTVLAPAALNALQSEQVKWREHGEQVSAWYVRITAQPDAYFGNDPLLSRWFTAYQPEDLRPYHLNHDIAKPFSQHHDENGKAHYGQDHSLKSSVLYSMLFGEDRFSQMIANDMAFHTARADTIESVWQLPDAQHLYATAWAELYANATMFGGLNSDSFKIKKKRLIWALKHQPA